MTNKKTTQYYEAIYSEKENVRLEATKERSIALATGWYSMVSALNAKSVACAMGAVSVVKGVKGSWLVIADWEYNGDRHIFKGVVIAQVDNEKVKANTWYETRDGQLWENPNLGE